MSWCNKNNCPECGSVDCELQSENSMLRKALQDIIDYIDEHSTGDDDLHYFIAPIAESALMAKAVKESEGK